MTKRHLYRIVEQVVIEEFRQGIESGLIPADAARADLQAMCAFNTELLFNLIDDDPHLKYLLSKTERQNFGTLTWEFLAA